MAKTKQQPTGTDAGEPAGDDSAERVAAASVEVVDSAPTEVVKLDSVTFAELKARFLNGGDSVAVEDPSVIEERIFNQMMAAETLADLLRPTNVVKADDIIGDSFVCHDVRFNESDYGDNQPYAIMEVTHPVLGRVAVSCGARTVCHQLLVMKYREWLPALLKIERAHKPTKAGYYPLNLAMGEEEPEAF